MSGAFGRAPTCDWSGQVNNTIIIGIIFHPEDPNHMG